MINLASPKLPAMRSPRDAKNSPNERTLAAAPHRAATAAKRSPAIDRTGDIVLIICGASLAGGAGAALRPAGGADRVPRVPPPLRQLIYKPPHELGGGRQSLR